MAGHFPLLAVATLLLVSQTLTLTSAEDDELVRDIEGEPLEVGSEYYIVSQGKPFRGITTSPNPKNFFRCPLYVVESNAAAGMGKPVKLSHTNSSISQIHLSTDLSIDSGFDAYCRADGIWSVKFNHYSRRFEVLANGASPFSNFQIRNKEGGGGGGYTLAHCHAVCDDLGVVVDNFAFKVLGYPSPTMDAILQVVFIKKKDLVDVAPDSIASL